MVYPGSRGALVRHGGGATSESWLQSALSYGGKADTPRSENWGQAGEAGLFAQGLDLPVLLPPPQS